MQEICKAKQKIARLWGKGKPKDVSYRLLTYVIMTEVGEDDVRADVSASGRARVSSNGGEHEDTRVFETKGMLWLNVVTGELVFLDSQEAALAASLVAGLSIKYAPWMDCLIEKRYLVPVETDDASVVESLRHLGRLLYVHQKKEISHYLVLPTTHCNARCFYCYERGLAGFTGKMMDDNTANQLIDFMEKHRGDESLSIRWYGGEPLLNVRQIDRICRGLKQRGVPFTSELITNGYLLSEALAARMAEDWNVTVVQITLDGTEEVYNRVKNYRNSGMVSRDASANEADDVVGVSGCSLGTNDVGDATNATCAIDAVGGTPAAVSPFQRVMHNIATLLAYQIPVVIRLNLGLHNANDLIALADELTCRFAYGAPQNGWDVDGKNTSVRLSDGSFQNTLKPSVYTIKLYEDNGEEPFTYTDAEFDMLSRKELELKQHLKGLEQYAPDERTLPYLTLSHCRADRNDSVVITPTGQISVCEQCLTGGFVGSLEEGVVHEELSEGFSQQEWLSPNCKTCQLLPTCLNLKKCTIFKKCHTDKIEYDIEKYRRECRSRYQAFRASGVQELNLTVS